MNEPFELLAEPFLSPGFLRVPPSNKIKVIEERLEEIEDEISDLRSEQSKLETQWERLTKAKRAATDDDSPQNVVKRFLAKARSLTGPEFECCERILAGDDDVDDIRRLREMLQNHCVELIECDRRRSLKTRRPL